MHLETSQLTDYLDGVLEPTVHASVRSHLLTCRSCAGRLQALRADQERIAAALTTFPLPVDVRRVVRARLARSRRWRMAGQFSALAGVCCVLLGLLLLSVRGSAAFGVSPNQLFIIDSAQPRLIALNVADGSVQAELPVVGATPSRLRYDQRANRLYLLTDRNLMAINPHTLQRVAVWEAGSERPATLHASLALDAQRGLMYVARPEINAIAVLDSATLVLQREIELDARPGELALSPTGDLLFTLDQHNGTLWIVHLATGEASALQLGRNDTSLGSWLVVAPDQQALYVLRGSIPARTVGVPSEPPTLWRLTFATPALGDAASLPDVTVLLPEAPALQDLALLADGRLAIARGNGLGGGVELLESQNLTVVTRFAPNDDQHSLVVDGRQALFALNWSKGRVSRYNPLTGEVVWRVEFVGIQPQEGVVVPGGWR